MAEHFSSRPKAYSKDRIETYLKLEECKQNRINILDIILKSLNKDENYVYNKKEVSFALFDKDTNLLPVHTTKEPVSILLNKIAE